MTVADLMTRFGAMPLERIRFAPFPGTATEEDLVGLNERKEGLYELVDGILVEKVMGASESFLAAVLIRILGGWAAQRRLGAVLGADGLVRLAPGLVRIPDVSFVAWDRLPNRRFP